MQMIYAHRGASGYAPENTLRAFDLAANMHADGVEIDVQRTKDGKLVVFHDETLERVTQGTGLLSEYTYDELKQYPLLHAVDGAREDTIPLFSDVLSLLRRRSLKLNVELKNSRNPYPGMEAEVLQMVREADMVEQTMYSSFNHYSLLRIKELQPSALCGILYEASLIHPWRYAASIGMDALHPQYAEPMLIERSEVREAHKLHLEVNPWIVNDTVDIRECVLLGCDRIISNYPDRAVSVLKSCRP